MNNMKFDVNSKSFEQFKKIIQLSSENASIIISKWLKSSFNINILDINLISIDKLNEKMKLNDEIVFAAITDLVGDVKGKFLFIFKFNDAFKILDMILKKPIGTTKENNELVESAVLETCNIISSSFTNSFVKFLNVQLVPSAPLICCDICEAILFSIFSEYAATYDEVFFINTEFIQKDEKLTTYFLVLPQIESLNLILNKLNN